MSLKTLFNTNYAEQTLKRFKGILLLMLIIVPLIIALLFSAMAINEEGDFEETYTIITVINGFGMVGIPFIVSNLFLNYVFSKKKVDFTNSMPISRKKIFLTNVFLGIGYFIAQQLLIMLVLSIFMLFTNVHITFSMIFDLCLIFTIGYSFMYSIYCLALSLSGTIYMQIVLSLLLLFFIPFTRFLVFRGFDMDQEHILLYVPNNITCRLNVTGNSDDILVTIPFRLLLMDAGDRFSVYNAKDMVLTAVITIAYIVLGMKMFERRKMETAEEAIRSNKLHLFVKALTLLPMVTAFYYIMDEMIDDGANGAFIIAIFGIGIIFAYYLIYDLITRKKIKLKVSIIAYICSFLVLIAFVSLGEKVYNLSEETENSIDYYDVESISMIDSYLYQSCNGRLNKIKPLSDEDAKTLLANLTDRDSEFNYRYAVDNNHEWMIIKLYNGKTYKTSVYVNRDADKELRNKLANDEEYIESIYNLIAINNNNYLEIDHEDTEEIRIKDNQLANDINSNLKDAIKTKILGRREATELYSVNKYEDHAVFECEVPLEYGSKTLDIVAKNINERTVEFIRTHNISSFDCSSIKLHKESDSIYKELYAQERLNPNEELINYIKEQVNLEIDSTKDLYSIEVIVYYGPDNRSKWLTFYTNNIESVNSIISKNVDVNKDFYYPYDEIDYDYYYPEEDYKTYYYDDLEEYEIPAVVTNTIDESTNTIDESANTTTNVTDNNIMLNTTETNTVSPATNQVQNVQ